MPTIGANRFCAEWLREDAVLRTVMDPRPANGGTDPVTLPKLVGMERCDVTTRGRASKKRREITWEWDRVGEK